MAKKRTDKKPTSRTKQLDIQDNKVKEALAKIRESNTKSQGEDHAGDNN